MVMLVGIVDRENDFHVRVEASFSKRLEIAFYREVQAVGSRTKVKLPVTDAAVAIGFALSYSGEPRPELVFERDRHPLRRFSAGNIENMGADGFHG